VGAGTRDVHGVLPADMLTVTLLFLLVEVHTATSTQVISAASSLTSGNSVISPTGSIVTTISIVDTNITATSTPAISAAPLLTNGNSMISYTDSVVTTISTVDTNIAATSSTPVISVSSSSTSEANGTGSIMSSIGSGGGSSLAPYSVMETSSTESTLAMPTPPPYSSQAIFPSSSLSSPPPTVPTIQSTFPLELALGVAVGVAGLLLLSLLLLLLCCCCCTMKKWVLEWGAEELIFIYCFFVCRPLERSFP